MNPPGWYRTVKGKNLGYLVWKGEKKEPDPKGDPTSYRGPDYNSLVKPRSYSKKKIEPSRGYTLANLRKATGRILERGGEGEVDLGEAKRVLFGGDSDRQGCQRKNYLGDSMGIVVRLPEEN